MKRPAWPLLVCLAAGAVACRGVLGIETLDLVSGSDASAHDAAREGAAGGDAGADAMPEASAEASPDVSVDTAPSQEAAIDDALTADDYSACISEGTNCRPCCRMSYMSANAQLTMLAAMQPNGCLCGTGSCQSDCASSLCGGGGGMPDMTCNTCFDMAILPPPGTAPSTACTQVVQQCQAAADCRDVIDCLEACGP